MVNKQTLKELGFTESPASFGIESMQKGRLELKKRSDLHTWRIYISSSWVPVKDAEQIKTLDKLFN